MKRFLKRFALISLVTIVVLLLLASALTMAFEKQIGRRVIAELNKQLATELRVEKFDLSVIRTFPNVAANLRGVELDDNRGGVLLDADNLSFRFGLFSLLTSRVKIKSVVVQNGKLAVRTDRKGNANYDILVKSETEAEAPASEGGSTAISLQSARLEDIELVYADEMTDQFVDLVVEEAEFSGEFSSSQFSLASDAQLQSRFFDIDGVRYLPRTALGYSAKVFVDLEARRYELEKVDLEVNNNTFKAEGAVERRDDGMYYDLVVSNEESNLGGVLALLPARYLDRLGGFESSGRFAFQASVQGLAGARQNPEIRVDLTLENGRISGPQLAEPLKDVALNASYDNGRSRNNASSRFEISNLKGYFNRELLEMQLRVDNFDAPRIDFAFDGVLPMKAIYGLFNNPRITAGEGELEIKNLVLKGDYADMVSTSRIGRVKAGGEVEFDDAGLTINGEEMRVDRGRLRLEDNALTLQDFQLEGAGSDILFEGAAFNLIPVLFADSLNSRRAELEFQAKLVSETLDLDRLMQLSAVTAEEAAAGEAAVDSLKAEKINKREQFTDLLNGTFTANVAAFNYHKIEGKDFEGLLEFNNNEMSIEGSTRAMNGAFDLNGRVYFQNEPYLRANLDCGGIDFKEFFRQTENFGQDVFQDRNISGTLNAKIAIDAFWDQQGNFRDDKLRVLAGIGIEDGEIVDFELLEGFSTFVKIKDLKRIKFISMTEYLEVRNRRLYIPALFIRSNALNLTVSGEHSFDNDIRYNIKVNAGQVLADRFRKYDPSLHPKEARRNGWFNLYYTITGTIDDYEVKSAKRQVKADFERSALRKRDIAMALRQEFGALDLIDEPEEWLDEGEEQEEFLWDEEEVIVPRDEEEETMEESSFLDWEADAETIAPRKKAKRPANAFFNKEKAVAVDTTEKADFLWDDDGD